ncbi:MAG: heme-degrading domain-containing protein [Spirochaetales bacterium]|nr:heme-degrading domain-containing protein [Spirochaetales bacterium]
MENQSNKNLIEQIKSITADEKKLIFNSFTNEEAWELGSTLYKEAKNRKASVTIDIRKGKHILFHYAMEGTSPNNDRWIERKSNTVQFVHKSSFLVGRENILSGETLESRQYLDSNIYAEHGGSFPINVKGVGIIGAVTVSGLPQEEDHKLVVDVIKKFLLN